LTAWTATAKFVPLAGICPNTPAALVAFAMPVTPFPPPKAAPSPTMASIAGLSNAATRKTAPPANGRWLLIWTGVAVWFVKNVFVSPNEYCTFAATASTGCVVCLSTTPATAAHAAARIPRRRHANDVCASLVASVTSAMVSLLAAFSLSDGIAGSRD